MILISLSSKRGGGERGRGPSSSCSRRHNGASPSMSLFSPFVRSSPIKCYHFYVSIKLHTLRIIRATFNWTTKPRCRASGDAVIDPPEHHLTVIMITIKNDPFIMSEVFIGIRAPNQSIGIQLPPTHHYIAT